jgi:hypothetical protein
LDILAVAASSLAGGTLHNVRGHVSTHPESQLSHSGAQTARALSPVLETLD